MVLGKSAAPAEDEVGLQSKHGLLGGIALYRQLLAGSFQCFILGLEIVPDLSIEVGGAHDVLIEAEVEQQLSLGLVGADNPLGALFKGDLHGFLRIVVGADGDGIVLLSRSFGLGGLLRFGGFGRSGLFHRFGGFSGLFFGLCRLSGLFGGSGRFGLGGRRRFGSGRLRAGNEQQHHLERDESEGDPFQGLFHVFLPLFFLFYNKKARTKTERA